MNILVVDDNTNNRMILKLFLEDYAEENGNTSLNIEEASDGIEAVQKCKDKSFDIIFMDIMMPRMDGIEATKIIRQSNDKIMIVAVSAVDDSDKKKIMLNNGAEDYISKPVNYDIFLSRMTNYKILVDTRKHKKISASGINPFTSEIFSRYTRFMITSEDSLSEFWEFFLLNARQKYDNLSDVVRILFAVAEMKLEDKKEAFIYIEESDDYQYFTLSEIEKISPEILKSMIVKNNSYLEYKITKDKISFKLEKKFSEVKEIVSDLHNSNIQNTKESRIVQTKVIKEETALISQLLPSSQALQVFDYMEAEDLYDLEEYAGKLSSLMLIVGSGDVTEEEVTEIYTYLEKIGSILATYSEIYPISKALSELAGDMATHVPEFTQNSEALGPMCKAFSNDMSNWIEMSFHTGAPSAEFMNDTIVVNCQTIGGMLKMDEQTSSNEDFDDIFDF